MPEFGEGQSKSRYDVKEKLKYLEGKVDSSERERARLVMVALNAAFDDLGYSGDRLPFLNFARDLEINGKRIQAAFLPEFEEDVDVICFDIGPNFLEGLEPKEYIDSLVDTNGLDKTSKHFLVHFAFEEAFHFVDATKGRLPRDIGPSARLPGYINYGDQPHEARAREFVKSKVPKYLDKIIAGSKKCY